MNGSEKLSEEEKLKYDLRFRRFLGSLLKVRQMTPKEDYLFPIMRGVPFCDLETALSMATAQFAKVGNDNRKDKK